MKILSLNTHSLHEPDYERKLDILLGFLLQNRPDMIAMQEVNQSKDAPTTEDRQGMILLRTDNIPLRSDNHGLRIAAKLKSVCADLSWTWLPIKLGYGKYDEGLCIMSLRGNIAEADVCTISDTDDYQNWRRRMLLGVRLENCAEWFYCVHMGFWQDAAEPFEAQWRRLEEHLKQKRTRSRVWLMGDFNAPAEIRGQGYDLIAQSGWQDAYLLAEHRGAGPTVQGAIDGWRESEHRGMRIDHIWCNERAAVRWFRTVFNGEDEPKVSDHFGVMLESIDEDECCGSSRQEV